MKLPALLPQELKYSEKAQNDEELQNILLGSSNDIITFFEYALGDETWGLNHSEFMKSTLHWMTERAFYDEIEYQDICRIAKEIHTHYKVDLGFVPKDIECIIEGEIYPMSTILLMGSSPLFRTVILTECRDKGKKTLELGEVDKHTFKVIQDFVNVGTVEWLWKLEKEEIVEINRQASEWEMEGLSEQCQEVLKRYIDKDNFIEVLLMTHREKWKKLRQSSIDFFNNRSEHLKIHDTDIDNMWVEFQKIDEDALDYFEHLKDYITKLTLPQESHFLEIMDQCPRLNTLDLSHTDSVVKSIPKKIEKLDMSHCPWLTDKNLEKILKLCPQITQLALRSNPQITYSGWGYLRTLGNLTYLDISRCRQIHDREIRLILQACKKLNHLLIEGCEEITDKGFFEITRNIPQVHHLNVSRTRITNEALVEIGMRCHELESIDLSRCENITDKGFLEFLSQTRYLKMITVVKCHISLMSINRAKSDHPFIEMITI